MQSENQTRRRRALLTMAMLMTDPVAVGRFGALWPCALSTPAALASGQSASRSIVFTPAGVMFNMQYFALPSARLNTNSRVLEHCKAICRL